MAIDPLAAAFGLQPVVDAVAASDAVRMGMDPNNMAFGPTSNYNAYLKAQQEQELAAKLKDEQERALRAKQMEVDGNEAIRRQQLLTTLLDMSGRTPSVDLGGSLREGIGAGLPGMANKGFTNQDTDRLAQMFPKSPAQPDALDRLFQMGSQMPKELFDALAGGVLKEQITPAASPQAIQSFFPQLSAEQLQGMGRVPQKAIQDLVFGKAKGEDRIEAMREGYRLRASEGAANREAKGADLRTKLEQQEKQFQQNQGRMSAADAARQQPRIPAKLAADLLEQAAAGGMDLQSQEILANGMGYSVAGTMDKGGMFGSTPTAVPGVPAMPQFSQPGIAAANRVAPTAPAATIPANPKKGEKGTSKSGKPMIFNGSKWEYEQVSPKADVSTPRG